MELDGYLLFVAASVLLCLSPGPDMALVIGKSLTHGRKGGLAAAIGINIGAYVHLLAAVVGLSTILMTSATAFTILKWCGAAYLIYLGVLAIRTSPQRLSIDTENNPGADFKTIFIQGFLSDALNPKVAIFYLAFLPQFLDPSDISQVRNLAILGITVNMIGLAMNIIFVFASVALSRKLRTNTFLSGWLNKMVGAAFIVMGARLAAAKS